MLVLPALARYRGVVVNVRDRVSQPELFTDNAELAAPSEPVEK